MIDYSCEFESRSWREILSTALCDNLCQRLVTGWWFSLGTSVSSTNKTDFHDIAQILLKMALITIYPTMQYSKKPFKAKTPTCYKGYTGTVPCGYQFGYSPGQK